jgi:hypothetical protein
MTNNALYLEQTRRGIKDNILKSPTQIIIYRNVLVDDGAGEGNLVPDPYHIDNTPITLTCRISKEQRLVQNVAAGATGLKYERIYYILVDYKITINESETFEALGTIWRIGPVEIMRKHGGIIGYRAILTEAAGAL